MEKANKSFTLSIKNINQILKTLSYQNDFTFVFHNQEYVTNKLVADLLSPAIAQIHQFDPTYDTFTFKNDDLNAELFDFNKILGLVDNQTYTIATNDELKIFKDIFSELKNEDSFALYPIFENEITYDNVFERIKLKQGFSPSSNINEELEFISKNFFKFSLLDEVKSFSLEIIESILFSENLVIYNEDSVFNFITSYSIEKAILHEKESLDNDKNSFIQLSELGIDFGNAHSSFSFLPEKFKNQELSTILINKEIFDNCFIVLMDSVIISNLSDNSLSIFLSLYNFHEMSNIIWEKVAMKILNIPINFQSKQKIRYYRANQLIENKPRKNKNQNNYADDLLTLYQNNSNRNNNLAQNDDDSLISIF